MAKFVLIVLFAASFVFLLIGANYDDSTPAQRDIGFNFLLGFGGIGMMLSGGALLWLMLKRRR
jgi:hypothetical protein